MKEKLSANSLEEKKWFPKSKRKRKLLMVQFSLMIDSYFLFEKEN